MQIVIKVSLKDCTSELYISLLPNGLGQVKMPMWISLKFFSKSYIICVEKFNILEIGQVKIFWYVEPNA